MRRYLLTFLLIAFHLAAQGAVVRPAPDFTFTGVGDKSASLKSFRGVPVVLIIARSSKSGDVTKQARLLRKIYEQFANKQVIFAAAFTDEPGPVQSDIPFVIANNGAAVASAYGFVAPGGKHAGISRMIPHFSGGSDQFTIVIIGKDGNIDYQTSKILPPERVRDVIQNSFAVQSVTGR